MPTAAKKAAAPAKKTAAKKTAAKKTTTSKTAASQPQQTVLYKAPAGWTYSVDLVGPDGTTISIGKSDLDSETKEYDVIVVSNGSERTQTVDSLPEALRQASTAAKALDKVVQRRAALEAANEEALNLFGEASGTPSTKSEPKPEDPATGEYDDGSGDKGEEGSSSIALADVD